MEEHKQEKQQNWFVKHRYISITAGIITLALIVVFIVRNNTGASSQSISEQEQPSPTTVMRHDNSGAGATSQDNQDNPLQDHFNHAMQHLGL